MIPRFACLLWILPAPLLAALPVAPVGMIRIPAGELVLPFRKDTAEIRLAVESFLLDARAVTESEYLAFIGKNPRFARSRIRRLFADSGYLKQWSGDFEAPIQALRSPVTRISWYAAKEYCACQGKRLPTTAEWERAAALPERDAAATRRAIMDWYAKPAGGTLPPAGSGTVNDYGIRDLFGVVWEWTSDFNAFGFAGLNQRGVEDSAQFCGGGTTRATQAADYATYMRWAFRLSLRPDYTVGTLGFRCARDAAGTGGW